MSYVTHTHIHTYIYIHSYTHNQGALSNRTHLGAGAFGSIDAATVAPGTEVRVLKVFALRTTARSHGDMCDCVFVCLKQLRIALANPNQRVAVKQVGELKYEFHQDF